MSTYEQLVAPIIKNGICVADTIYLEPDSLRLIGRAIAPRNEPSTLEAFVNGQPLRMAVYEHHPELAQRHKLENVYGFEAVGPIPAAELLKFTFAFASTPAASQAVYYFDLNRPPLPEGSRRARVHGTEEINSFDLSGCTLAHNLIEVVERTLKRKVETLGPVLDWGCGSGRVGRFLFPKLKAGFGVDIDHDNAAWCEANIPGTFSTIALDPPMPFPDEHFDFIYGISVLTHLGLKDQDAWLAELARITKQGGVLMLSTHGFPSALNYGASKEFFPQLEQIGFVDAGFDNKLEGHSPEPERYRTTYHTPDYIRKHWSKRFEVVDVLEGWTLGNQDMVVLRPKSGLAGWKEKILGWTK